MSSIFIFILFILNPHFVHAAESGATIRLAPIPVSASASFETLSDDSFLPVDQIKLDQDHADVVNQLSKSSAYPIKNFGYPAGALGINLDGRTVEDTQVFTLGVPLNLPQGGGTDLSLFPNYLWSEVDLSQGLSTAGFSPQAASGSVQLKPWTRERVRDQRYQNERLDLPMNRMTVAYDRDLQTYSLGTSKDNFAVLMGATTGQQEGIAGEFSDDILKTARNHLLLHMIGSSQDGSNPGSSTFPSPFAHKKSWSLIPVIESHQEFESDWIVESTLFANLSSLLSTDPGSSASAATSSDSRTQQYGIENAILYGPYTLALSARYTTYENSSYDYYVKNTHVGVHEWPYLVSLSRDFYTSSKTTFKLTASGTGTPSVSADSPVAAGARAGWKFEETEHRTWFSELSTTPKMPSLVARYYQYPSSTAAFVFRGNPNLKPERVNAALFGLGFKNQGFQATSTLKAEYRNQIQINQNQTTQNAGNAYLFSAKQDLNYQLLPQVNLETSTLLTYSKMIDRKLPYPDLAPLTQQLSVNYSPIERWTMGSSARYQGPSIASDGRFHPNYFLMDASVSALFKDTFIADSVKLTAGLENIFDNRAQLVLDYPLPGRKIYLSLQAVF